MSIVNTDGGAGAMVLTTVKYGRLRLSRLRGAFGILDPSDETIREQINRLRDLGRLTWELRLRRDAGTGWRAKQASNAYCLLPFSCDADCRPGVRFVLKEGRKAAPKEIELPAVSADERQMAQDALARRRTAMLQRMLRGVSPAALGTPGALQ